MSGGVTTHVRGGVVVRALDEDNPIHAPMSLRTRASVLDLWLAVEKCPESIL